MKKLILFFVFVLFFSSKGFTSQEIIVDWFDQKSVTKEVKQSLQKLDDGKFPFVSTTNNIKALSYIDSFEAMSDSLIFQHTDTKNNLFFVLKDQEIPFGCGYLAQINPHEEFSLELYLGARIKDLYPENEIVAAALIVDEITKDFEAKSVSVTFIPVPGIVISPRSQALQKNHHALQMRLMRNGFSISKHNPDLVLSLTKRF